MIQRIGFSFAFTFCISLVADAETLLFSDNFDSYSDTAAFNAAWPVVGSQPTGTLSTAQSASSPKSIFIPGTASNASAARNEHTFTETGNQSGSNVIRYSFDFYDSNGTANAERNYSNLVDGLGTNSGQLISMGLNNNLLLNWDGGNYYMARILGYTPTYKPQLDPQTPAQPAGTSGAYFKLNDGPASTLRSTGWHNLAVQFTEGLYQFYVDNTLAKSISYTPPTPRSFDTVRLGSGLSNNNRPAYFDNVKVELNPGLIEELSGDFNEDGRVDEADYVSWRRNETANNSLPNDSGHGTQAGRFDLWKQNFGEAGFGSGADHGSPVVSINPGGSFASGRLNAQGNWVWKVQISPSNPIPSGTSALAAALGFRATGSALLDANSLSTGAGDDFDTVIPGAPIWGWENPGTGTNGFPEGLQSNCAGGLCTENTPGDDPNSVFASLGSQNYNTTGVKDFIEIITQGPAVGRLSTTITMSGVFGTGSNKGRIAEWSPSPPPDSINHDTYASTVSFTAKPGDANLDNSVDVSDYNLWLSHIGVPAVEATWQNGDFNDDDSVDSVDYHIWLASVGSGAGSGDGSVIPEPASLLLVALTVMLLSSVRFCRTSKHGRLRNRFKVASVVATIEIAFLSGTSSQAANLHLTVDYAGSYDAVFNPLPGSPPAPLFSQIAPHPGAPPAVHVPGAIHQFDVYMAITGTVTGEDFQSVIFDLLLGPGVTPLPGGAYLGEDPQIDPPGLTPSGSIFSQNGDAGPSIEDLKAITVIAHNTGSHARTHAAHPGEADATTFFPTKLGSAFVNWDGTFGPDDKSWVAVSQPANVLNPWSTVIGNTGTAHPAGNMTVGPREEWVGSNNPSVAGDYNKNGTVDAADYVIWRKGLGTTFTQGDYDTWRSHFGQTAGTGSSQSQSVPEPKPFLLLSISIMLSLTAIDREQH